jgi:hypothetical protein
MTVQEPSFLWQNFFVWVMPFIAYFFGIVVRRKLWPGKDSPGLGKQLLLGIPLSLVVVSPFLTFLRHVMSTDVTVYLFNLGVLAEQGMVLQEAATRLLPAGTPR